LIEFEKKVDAVERIRLRWFPASFIKILNGGRPRAEGGYSFVLDAMEENEEILGIESKVLKNVKRRLFLQNL
jgi:hypothetical protein